jgi:tetratricopeptide (TPR) repeat protein
VRGKILNAVHSVLAQRKLLATAILSFVLTILVLATVYSLIPHEVKLSPNPTVAEYQRALPKLKTKADENKKSVDAQKNYAIALYASGDAKAAKAQYEKVIQLNPSDASAYNYLANAQRDLGQTNDAIVSYKKAISLDSKQVNYYANLANVQLYTLHKPEDAISTYQKGLEAVPHNSQLEFLLGTTYENNGNTEAAKQTYENILSYDPTNQLAKTALERLHN